MVINMELNVKVDSRKVKKGDTFIALRGISSDGHDYIESAIKNGASKLIVEEDKNYSVEYEVVSDTRAYLINYLKENYSKYLNEMKIIGITGTNGKTTSAYLLHNALNLLGIKTAYIGTIGFYINKKIESLNNTTPDVLDLFELLLKSYGNGCKYVCMEVSSQGLSHKRVEGFLFDYVIFTNLTQDHLDYHKTMENYCLAKQELFRKLKPNGTAIINYDDEYKNYFLLPNNNNITYGFLGGDYQITNFKMTNQKTTFSYDYNGNHYNIASPLLGKFNVYNLLVTIIVLRLMNIPEKQIENLCVELEAPNGRMDTICYGTNSIIVDYAHTPDALSKIINTMLEVTNGHIYTVFGCTGDRDRGKRPIMTNIACKLSAKVILTHDDPHNEDQKQIFDDMTNGIKYTNYEICYDRKEAIIKGIGYLKDNDTLLVLGKGHEEFIINGNEKIPFNDRTVILEYLNNK